LLERVAQRLAAQPDLAGLTGRAVDPSGSFAPSWAKERGVLRRNTLWNRAISFAIFLRREVVERLGRFDEAL
ncbi:MAG: glycosyltransferase family 2 protein, partial [Thermoleophilia bacterium]